MSLYSSLAFIDANSTFLDKLSTSGISSLIGIGIVFTVLAVLVGAITLINIILDKIENKNNQNDKTLEKSKTVVPVVEVPESVSQEVSADEQNRIVAAITAALTIAAFDKPNARFIVKKIRKI